MHVLLGIDSHFQFGTQKKVDTTIKLDYYVSELKTYYLWNNKILEIIQNDERKLFSNKFVSSLEEYFRRLAH